MALDLFPEIRTKQQEGVEFEMYIQRIVKAIDAVQIYIISRFFRKRTIRIFPVALPSKKGNVDKYVRLLSFTNEQVDDFFRNYGVTIEGIQLTYGRAKELNLPVEEMTTPLFAWIFSYLEMHTSPEFKMESKRNWNAKMT